MVSSLSKVDTDHDIPIVSCAPLGVGAKPTLI
jgi:hypothetical protein